LRSEPDDRRTISIAGIARALGELHATQPGHGVAWTELSDSSAVATLSAGGTHVSLEFRFNQRLEPDWRGRIVEITYEFAGGGEPTQ
jgi:hypothetical protein